jgi:hypothetical protein
MKEYKLFDIFEEAEANLPLNESLGFCPMINRDCHPDCVVYHKARVSFHVIPLKGVKYRAIGPYCDNPLISGMI